MNYVKKVGVVTATRAEYGLFVPLLKELDKSEHFQLQLYVTGTHLSHEFGFTKKNILEDGFEICEEIDCLVGNDTPPAIAKTSGLALIGLTEAYYRQRPDLIFLLGDRYETLCAAMAASFCRIPIAHLHGGEITEGAYDEGFRHAITKLSHLHFTSTEEHRNRVIQLGENPCQVFNVGAIGIDNIKSIKPIPRKDLEADLGIQFQNRNVLVTLHPETLKTDSAWRHASILIEALSKLDDCTIIITGANADSEGRIINEKMREFSRQKDDCIFVQSLGLIRYLSVLNIVDMVIGNSSSGIIEVPAFGIPTINIGDRQSGRLKADTVRSVSWSGVNILNEIESSFLKSPISSREIKNPYGVGKTAERILDVLQNNSFESEILIKKFNDLDWR